MYDDNYLNENSPFRDKNFTGVLKLLEEEKSKKIRVGILELNELMELQTAFIQYWNFFDDYVEEAKGKKITFNVKKHPLGIQMEIEVSDEISLIKVEEYLSEYASYLKEKIIDVKEKVTRKALEKEIELLGLQIRQQKSNFERQIDILVTANKILESDKGKFFKLLENYSSRPQYLGLNQSMSQQQGQISQSSANIVNFNISQVQNSFSNLVGELQKHQIFKDIDYQEAKVIQDALDEIPEDISSIEIPTGKKAKIKRFFRKLIDKVKDSKALLIDMPAVALVLYSCLNTLMEFLTKLGSDFDTTANLLRSAVLLLKQIT